MKEDWEPSMIDWHLLLMKKKVLVVVAVVVVVATLIGPNVQPVALVVEHTIVAVFAVASEVPRLLRRQVPGWWWVAVVLVDYYYHCLRILV